MNLKQLREIVYSYWLEIEPYFDACGNYLTLEGHVDGFERYGYNGIDLIEIRELLCKLIDWDYQEFKREKLIFNKDGKVCFDPDVNWQDIPPRPKGNWWD